MNQDNTQTTNFQPIFDYIDQSTLTLKEDLTKHIDEKLSNELGLVKTAMDTLIAETRKYHQEMESIRHQFLLLKDWAVSVSAKTGIPLPF
ncbi:MAG TPA: hypothetical protein VEA59_04685 [Patescibacteria group bacterium]|nr:hypothetical protein [Patescibacteria group bacterium]